MQGNIRVVLLLAVVSAPLGCVDGRGSSGALQMTGTVMCVPGSGVVETWCDDVGQCEIRVVDGPTFTCDLHTAGDCAQVAADAAAACAMGSGGDGSVASGGPDAGVQSPSVCPELCSTCADRCEDCADLEGIAREAGCREEFTDAMTCIVANECCASPESCAIACGSASGAFGSCACPALLPRLQAEAAACGRTFSRTCADQTGAAIIVACLDAVSSDGCASFDTLLCGNGL